MASDIIQLVATIASGASLSDAKDMRTKTVVGIVMPATWTAADLTFQVSSDGGTTFREFVGDAGAAVQYQVDAATQIAINPALWRGIDQIKVRSGTSSAAITQAADRAVTLLVRAA